MRQNNWLIPRNDISLTIYHVVLLYHALTLALVKLCSRSCKGERHIASTTRRLKICHSAWGKCPG